MKTGKLTKAESFKQEYASNQQCILKSGILSENEYNNLWLDAGKAFLEDFYPSNDPKYADLHMLFRYKRCYWRWFFKKWKDWERDLIQDIQLCQIELTTEIYIDEMKPMIHSHYVHENFQTYLKVLINEI